jgi:hypothetical protein
MDPKAITKDELYGVLDASTLEWTDGMFTHCVRKVIDNQRGEVRVHPIHTHRQLNKRQWIVFDGDVDPEWVENLNSVLDDNKLLTLPNGERLALPPNLTIIFEVQDLRNATLATVSRCGMVWFSEVLPFISSCSPVGCAHPRNVLRPVHWKASHAALGAVGAGRELHGKPRGRYGPSPRYSRGELRPSPLGSLSRPAANFRSNKKSPTSSPHTLQATAWLRRRCRRASGSSTL